VTRDDHEDDIAVEEIERRRHVRGITSGLRVRFVAPRTAEFEAVEASRRSFFVHVDDPERYRLGDVYDASIEHGGRTAPARLEVIRKEIDPRRGVALRIVHIAPEGESALREMLGPLAETGDPS
jgi:hypothetical protein